MHLCQRFFQSSKYFWNALFAIANSSSFDFSCISSIVAKRFPFPAVFSFTKRKNVSGSQVWWIRWLRHDYGFVFGQKLTHKHRCVSWRVIILQNPWLVFPQFCEFLTNYCTQLAHNFKLIFLIDPTTRWQDSWCTTPLQSKKTLSKTFIFDRIWHAFFSLRSSGRFHWDDWTLVSMS